VSEIHNLTKDFEASTDYVWPTGTTEQEYHSMSLQMSRAKEARENYLPPNDLEWEQLLNHAENAYFSTQFQIPQDFGSYDHFLRVLDNLDATSSPGLPYCRTYPTIGALFGSPDKLQWNPDVKKKVWMDVKTTFRDEIDPIFAVFIKEEAHKPAKALEGRWRLIFASSLVHQIIGHMVLDTHHAKEIATTYDHPSLYGMIIQHGGWKQFKRLQTALGLSHSYDRKAWDLQSPGWVYKMRKELRKRLCLNPNPLWVKLLDWYYHTSYISSKIMFSDGQTYRQVIDGVMKSGLVSTISDNSCAQFLEHALASMRLSSRKSIPLHIKPIFCVGDDTLQPPEEFQEEYLELLQQAGCVIKEAHVSLKAPEFVGFRFYDTGPVPSYFSKHLTNVAHQREENLPEHLEAMLLAYINSKYRRFWIDVADAFGVRTRSEDYYRTVMNFPTC